MVGLEPTSLDFQSSAKTSSATSPIAQVAGVEPAGYLYHSFGDCSTYQCKYLYKIKNPHRVMVRTRPIYIELLSPMVGTKPTEESNTCYHEAKIEQVNDNTKKKNLSCRNNRGTLIINEKQ